ncbi:MAG: hypothetical protein Q4A70_02195 [Candidatus Saccharibacteria bacterium]|nr:hypothetical protein [Candidatus Saccharibacteria bacterium]
MKKVPFCSLLVPAGLVVPTILAGAFLTLPNTNADDVVDQINITVPESCTVEPVVSHEHTKTVQNNQYYSGIGTTTFKTYCNDNNGYAIYAVGYSNDEVGNTLMKHNSSSSYDFNTGTATSGDTSNWAMQLSAISGTYAPTIHSDTNGAFSSYHVVPSEYTKVVSFASNTDLPATGVNADGSGFTSTYAAWISATQPAGTYIGKVRYQLVHPMTEMPLYPQTTEAGCIRYYPNGGNVEGTMGCQPIAASDTSATLLASNFSRAGYGFAGWSKTYDYSDSTGFLGPQEDITFTAGQYTGSNNGLSLYARWIKSAGNLQGWTGCSTMASGAVTALTDQRDGETYAVAKLADGNCWMIENIRLENTNSDNATGALAQGYGGQFAGLADPEIAWTNNITTANSLYSTDGADDTINIGTSNARYRFPRYNNLNTPANASNRPQNPSSNTFTTDSTTVGMYSYGNYYTWSATIADTTAYSSDNHNTTSICPTGWRIPTGNTSGEFYALNTSVNSGATDTTASKGLRMYPNNFVYSGYVGGGSVYSRGSSGSYWSSTASYSLSAYYLSLLDSSNVNPGTNDSYKYLGRSIRCLVSGT